MSSTAPGFPSSVFSQQPGLFAGMRFQKHRNFTINAYVEQLMSIKFTTCRAAHGKCVDALHWAAPVNKVYEREFDWPEPFLHEFPGLRPSRRKKFLMIENKPYGYRRT